MLGITTLLLHFVMLLIRIPLVRGHTILETSKNGGSYGILAVAVPGTTRNIG